MNSGRWEGREKSTQYSVCAENEHITSSASSPRTQDKNSVSNVDEVVRATAAARVGVPRGVTRHNCRATNTCSTVHVGDSSAHLCAHIDRGWNTHSITDGDFAWGCGGLPLFVVRESIVRHAAIPERKVLTVAAEQP